MPGSLRGGSPASGTMNRVSERRVKERPTELAAAYRLFPHRSRYARPVICFVRPQRGCNGCEGWRFGGTSNYGPEDVPSATFGGCGLSTHGRSRSRSSLAGPSIAFRVRAGCAAIRDGLRASSPGRSCGRAVPRSDSEFGYRRETRMLPRRPARKRPWNRLGWVVYRRVRRARRG